MMLSSHGFSCALKMLLDAVWGDRRGADETEG
jgi:hypothetical protein